MTAKPPGKDVPWSHPFGADYTFGLVLDRAYWGLLNAPGRESSANCTPGILHSELEDGLIPSFYKPRDGDRVYLRGRRIVDCGHNNFTTELHPPTLVVAARTTSTGVESTLLGVPYRTLQRYQPANRTFHEQLAAEIAAITQTPIPINLRSNITTTPFEGPVSAHYRVAIPPARGKRNARLAYHFSVRSGVTVTVMQPSEFEADVSVLLDPATYAPPPAPACTDHQVTLAEAEYLNGMPIISPTSHSSAKFLHGIKVLMAKNYIENLSEEVKKGMHEKARQGSWPTVAPIAYNNTKDAGGIRPDPQQAAVVRELFQAAATGTCSLDDLTTLAKERGLHTRHNHPVAKSKIARLLQHDVYTGNFTWGGKTYQGTYEPIITTSLFDTVQDVLHGRSHPRTQTHSFIYTGLLRCAACDGLLSGDLKKGKYVYYACRGKNQCKTHYAQRTFEEETLRVLRSLAIEEAVSDWIINDLATGYDDHATRDTQASNRTQQRLDQLRDLQAKSYEDKLHGTISETAWREHHERWQREAEELEAQIATAAPRVSREEFLRIVRTPLELAQHAATQYIAQNEAEKARLLKILCSNYRVDAGTITVQMRSPFDALLKAAQSGDWLGGRDLNPDSRCAGTKSSSLRSRRLGSSAKFCRSHPKCPAPEMTRTWSSGVATSLVTLL